MAVTLYVDRTAWFAHLGAAWGAYLKVRKPEVYDGIGCTAMAPEHEEAVELPTVQRPH